MPTYDRGFQLGLLPEKKWNWRTFATSYGLLTGLILLLILVGIMTSDTLIPSVSYHVTELIPRPSLRPEALPKPKPLPVHAKLLPREPVFQAPKLIVPHEIRAPKPQPQEIEPPKVAMNNFAPAVLKPTSGARPVLIHTGEFAGSSVTPTVNAPIEKVQTGGFGDPNGLKPSANSKPNGKLIASAAGSFDMPVGPGQGNGSGGAKGIKGTVEITFKPNPAYTDEAKTLKLEGEVLLEVEFLASGQLHVNRVVRGLGHGLDETAVAAANKMRFKPAMRNGQAMDSTAIVHVVFQLAY